MVSSLVTPSFDLTVSSHQPDVPGLSSLLYDGFDPVDRCFRRSCRRVRPYCTMLSTLLTGAFDPMTDAFVPIVRCVRLYWPMHSSLL